MSWSITEDVPEGSVVVSEEMAAITSTSIILVLSLVTMAAVRGSPSASPPPHTLEEAAHRLDMILNNTRSRENYIRCFMDRGICNKDALSIKKILTDALATNCSNCTHTQKMGADRFFEYLQANQRQTWDKLTDKYGKGMVKEEDDDDSEDSDDDDDDEKAGKGGQGVQGVQGGQGVGHNSTTMSPTITTSTISIIF